MRPSPAASVRCGAFVLVSASSLRMPITSMGRSVSVAQGPATALALLDTDTGANAAAFSANPTGIVAGVGAEMRVWNNWVVGLEYLHYAISSDTNIGTSLPVTDIGPNVGNHWSVNGADTIRARASYLFNWGRY